MGRSRLLLLAVAAGVVAALWAIRGGKEEDPPGRMPDHLEGPGERPPQRDIRPPVGRIEALPDATGNAVITGRVSPDVANAGKAVQWRVLPLRNPREAGGPLPQDFRVVLPRVEGPREFLVEVAGYRPFRVSIPGDADIDLGLLWLEPELTRTVRVTKEGGVPVPEARVELVLNGQVVLARDSDASGLVDLPMSGALPILLRGGPVGTSTACARAYSSREGTGEAPLEAGGTGGILEVRLQPRPWVVVMVTENGVPCANAGLKVVQTGTGGYRPGGKVLGATETDADGLCRWMWPEGLPGVRLDVSPVAGETVAVWTTREACSGEGPIRIDVGRPALSSRVRFRWKGTETVGATRYSLGVAFHDEQGKWLGMTRLEGATGVDPECRVRVSRAGTSPWTEARLASWQCEANAEGGRSLRAESGERWAPVPLVDGGTVVVEGDPSYDRSLWVRVVGTGGRAVVGMSVLGPGEGPRLRAHLLDPAVDVVAPSPQSAAIRLWVDAQEAVFLDGGAGAGDGEAQVEVCCAGRPRQFARVAMDQVVQSILTGVPLVVDLAQTKEGKDLLVRVQGLAGSAAEGGPAVVEASLWDRARTVFLGTRSGFVDEGGTWTLKGVPDGAVAEVLVVDASGGRAGAARAGLAGETVPEIEVRLDRKRDVAFRLKSIPDTAVGSTLTARMVPLARGLPDVPCTVQGLEVRSSPVWPTAYEVWIHAKDADPAAGSWECRMPAGAVDGGVVQLQRVRVE